jgi:hypothetical protein
VPWAGAAADLYLLAEPTGHWLLGGSTEDSSVFPEDAIVFPEDTARACPKPKLRISDDRERADRLIVNAKIGAS